MYFSSVETYKKDFFHKKVFGSVEKLNAESADKFSDSEGLGAVLVELGGVYIGGDEEEQHHNIRGLNRDPGDPDYSPSREHARRTALVKQMRNRCFRVESCEGWVGLLTTYLKYSATRLIGTFPQFSNQIRPDKRAPRFNCQKMPAQA